jgi:thiol-disulfide isomerase/thioredoxin
MSDGTERTLDRRHLLAGLAGAGLLGAGVLGRGALDAAVDVTGSSPAGADARRLPVEVTTLDATGSEAGTTSVPVVETPTVVDCFATWCGPCADQMASLGAVHDRYADRVTFVSVTNERFGDGLGPAELRDWWREHDGRWTLGHDPEGDLMAALGATGLPYLAVTDETGAVTWTHGGVASAETLADRIERVL